MDGPPPAVPATGRWSSSAPWWTPCVALSKSRTPWSSATRASAGRGRRERVERTLTFGRLPFRQLPGQEFEDGHFGNDELRALPHKHHCLLSRACRELASTSPETPTRAFLHPPVSSKSAHPARTFCLRERKLELVRCSSLVDWPMYPRLAHTMEASNGARNAVPPAASPLDPSQLDRLVQMATRGPVFGAIAAVPGENGVVASVEFGRAPSERRLVPSGRAKSSSRRSGQLRVLPAPPPN